MSKRKSKLKAMAAEGDAVSKLRPGRRNHGEADREGQADRTTSASLWSRAQLAEWGVPWPPPKGWRKKLTDGVYYRERAAAIARVDPTFRARS